MSNDRREDITGGNADHADVIDVESVDSPRESRESQASSPTPPSANIPVKAESEIPGPRGGSGKSQARSAQDKLNALNPDFNPNLPEPEMPSNSLARLYSSMAKNQIEWGEYKKQYMLMSEKQAELLRTRADHIIAKAKVIQDRELEQLREILSMHNTEVISGLQQSSHDTTQSRLKEIADDYLKYIRQFADYPPEIRTVMLTDAARLWDHARKKVLKYALELTENGEGE